jgi:hypothetical protein
VIRESFHEEFKLNDAVLRKTQKKPAQMTTTKAVQQGEAMKNARIKLQNKSMTKTAFDELQKEKAFKDVSVFHEFFGADWDIINRIACDPAHELQNLVKDMLALVHTQLVVITANLLFTIPNCML